jgi:hypothetical protein
MARSRHIGVVRTDGRMVAASSSSDIALFFAHLFLVAVIRSF